MKLFGLILCFAAVTVIGCKNQPLADNKDTVIHSQHMSRQEAADAMNMILTTNEDGTVVMRARDADGKVEQVKTP
jgi:hypothetical protein